MNQEKNMSILREPANRTLDKIKSQVISYINESADKLEALEEMVVALKQAAFMYEHLLKVKKENQHKDLESRFVTGAPKDPHEEKLGSVIQRTRKNMGLSTWGIVKQVDRDDFTIVELRNLERSSILPNGPSMLSLCDILRLTYAEMLKLPR